MNDFEFSAGWASLIEDLARDFAFADVLCRLWSAAGEEPPKFCGDELTRIWRVVQEHRLNWFERQIIYGRIEIIT